MFKTTREPDFTAACDSCNERVSYHGAVRGKMSREVWLHYDCMNRPKGRMRPVCRTCGGDGWAYVSPAPGEPAGETVTCPDCEEPCTPRN